MARMRNQAAVVAARNIETIPNKGGYSIGVGHKRTQMIKLTNRSIIFTAVFGLLGCAALGTSLHIADANLFDNIRTVFVSSSQYSDAIINEIQSQKVFIISKDSLKADAIVFCEIGFDPKRFEVGAIAKIKIVQPATGNIIAQSEHNTFYGNSYMMPPSLEQAISDAIKGSIQCLSKKRKR
jgi:hypothetical protein